MSLLDRLKCLWSGHEYEPIHRIKFEWTFGYSLCTLKRHKRKGGWKATPKVKSYRCVRCGKRITVTKANELMRQGGKNRFLGRRLSISSAELTKKLIRRY